MKWVLLPGMDGTGELFAPLLRALPPRLEPIVVRYPLDQPLGYEQLRAFAEAKLPTDEPYFLLGESFSGPIALELAARAGPELRGLVLCATFLKSPVRGLLKGLMPSARLFVHGPPPRFVLRRFLAGPEADDPWVRECQRIIGSVSPRVIAERIKAIGRVDATAACARIRAPVLYLSAADDQLVPPRCEEELRAVLPGMETARFPSPHLLLQTRAGQVVSELVRWSTPLYA